MMPESSRAHAAQRSALRVLCLLVIISLTSPLVAVAQETAEEREALLREHSSFGDRVVVTLESGAWRRGELLGVRDARLRLRTYDERVSRFHTDELSLMEIDRLTVLRGTKDPLYVAGGAAVVAIAGVLMALDFTDYPENSTDRVAVAISLGVVGAMAGGLAAFLIAPVTEVPVVVWSFR